MGNGSGIMFYGPMMELLEINTIVPTVFQLGDLIGFSQLNFLGRNSVWSLHYFEMVWLHKESEGVPRDFLACQLGISDNAMRSCL